MTLCPVCGSALRPWESIDSPVWGVEMGSGDVYCPRGCHETVEFTQATKTWDRDQPQG
jgi:hypothetical protein